MVNKVHKIGFFIAIVLVVLFAVGCAHPLEEVGVEEVEPEVPGVEEEPEEVEEPTPTEAPTVKEFTITAKRFSFTPSVITVNAGDTVKLSITSTDVTHGFAISTFGVSERLSPGQTTEVEFVADKAGTYSFFCTVPCGSGHSTMRGTLIVEP